MPRQMTQKDCDARNRFGDSFKKGDHRRGVDIDALAAKLGGYDNVIRPLRWKVEEAEYAIEFDDLPPDLPLNFA
jgi:hypothetical protein